MNINHQLLEPLTKAKGKIKLFGKKLTHSTGISQGEKGPVSDIS